MGTILIVSENPLGNDRDSNLRILEYEGFTYLGPRVHSQHSSTASAKSYLKLFYLYTFQNHLITFKLPFKNKTSIIQITADKNRLVFFEKSIFNINSIIMMDNGAL